jgi:hypothetical protein
MHDLEMQHKEQRRRKAARRRGARGVVAGYMHENSDRHASPRPDQVDDGSRAVESRPRP